MAKINVEIDDEDHIELKLSSTRHRTSIKKIVNRLIKSYLKEERLIRQAKESSKEAKPSAEGKASTPDKVELEEAPGASKKKEVSSQTAPFQRFPIPQAPVPENVTRRSEFELSLLSILRKRRLKMATAKKAAKKPAKKAAKKKQ